MKTRLRKLLLPGFLRRLDDYLLEYYPVAWRTQGHYVLWFALLLTPLLFAAGFLYPLHNRDFTEWAVDPIKPVILGDELLYIAPLLFLGLGISYWGYRQFQSGFPWAGPWQVLSTLAMYGVCLFVITGITAPAFRIGTITHVAYGFIDTADIDAWDRNDFFLFGALFRDSDNYTEKPDTSFWEQRELDFKKLWRGEEHILSNRYNNYFWDSLILDEPYRSYLSYLSDESYQSYRSYRSYRSYLLDRSYLAYLAYLPDLAYLLDKSDRSFLLDKSDRLYLSDLSFLSYRSHLSHLSDRSYRSYLLDRLDWLDRMDRSFLLDKSDRLYLSDRSYRSDYRSHYTKEHASPPSQSIPARYGIPIVDETLQSGTFAFIRPAYIYTMENAIRSVRHARLYLNEWIIFRHWRVLLCYLCLLALLLFPTPYLSFRYFLAALTVTVGTTAAGKGLKLDIDSLDHWTWWDVAAYLIVPVAGVLWLAFAAMRQKRYGWVPIAYHLLFVGMAGVLFFALFGETWVFANEEAFMGKPVNIAFFGVQALGLAGTLLMAYVQTLPKQE